jgi:hypothetical protein
LAEQAKLLAPQLEERLTVANNTAAPSAESTPEPSSTAEPASSDSLQDSSDTAIGMPLQTTLGLYYTLDSLKLPIGWPDTAAPELSDPWFFSFFLRKLIGLAVTIFAVSQGAPFWFDLLNKLTNLRSGGKPPAKTEAENDEDASGGSAAGGSAGGGSSAGGRGRGG